MLHRRTGDPDVADERYCSASPCVLGSTLTDTATLTGAASQPGSGGAEHCLSDDQSR